MLLTGGSPSVYLLWAVLAVLGFLILHLWAFDRFACVKWDHGRQPGAFKRFMTYSYLATVPLLMIFSVTYTVLKYKSGYIYDLSLQIATPTPIDLWDQSNKRWVLPLYFVFSFAWALEIITHLEELTFWLFLLHQGPSKRNWFQSWEFRSWYLGSMVAFLGMPLTVLIRRRTLETCLAWIFIAGSSASSFTTVCFTYVLARFPWFIRRVKSEGAEPDVIVRLTAFYHLNLIRVGFRVCFNLPLLICGLDGVQGSHSIIANCFWGDFLLMIGGVGCFVSSAITLLIFFPRSVSQETQASGVKASQPPYYHREPPPKSPSVSVIMSPTSTQDRYHHEPHMSSFRFPPDRLGPGSPHFAEGEATPEYESDPENDLPSKGGPANLHHRPHEHYSPYPYERHPHVSHMQEEAISSTAVHPYVMTFTSPIDLLDLPDDPEAAPRAL